MDKIYDEAAIADALNLVPSALFINGTYIAASSGETFCIINPANGNVVTDVPLANADDVDLTVKAARQAFNKGYWRRLAPAQRKKILLKFSDLMVENKETLGLLNTLCMGKPITSAINGEVPSAASVIAYAAEAIDKFYGEVAPTAPDHINILLNQPLGVVAAIVPWNYPLSMAAWKIGPALATGNSVILKPAEQSPLSALFLGKLANEAGIPAGVLNILPGDGPTTGQSLGLHPDIDCITFTGSTEVGKKIMGYAAQSNLKRVSLECGGKSPHIVLADCADIAKAADEVAKGIFTNSGQVCSAGSRLILEKSIRQPFLAELEKAAKKFVPGDPLNPRTNMGPLVSSDQLKKAFKAIDTAIAEGGTLFFGGTQATTNQPGYFLQPTIIIDVKNSHTLAQEEVFGPVLAVIDAEDFDDALKIANDTIYGLAAGIWTSSNAKALKAMENLHAGIVWVNCYEVGSQASPFGGFKQSGFGRDKSVHALEKYVDIKSCWVAA